MVLLQHLSTWLVGSTGFSHFPNLLTFYIAPIDLWQTDHHMVRCSETPTCLPWLIRSRPPSGWLAQPFRLQGVLILCTAGWCPRSLRSGAIEVHHYLSISNKWEFWDANSSFPPPSPRRGFLFFKPEHPLYSARRLLSQSASIQHRERQVQKVDRTTEVMSDNMLKYVLQNWYLLNYNHAL